MDAPSPGSECPVCAGVIGERERVVCPRCETPHHADCYSYNQGCALFGCNPDRKPTPLPKKPLAGWVRSANQFWSSRASRVTLFLAVSVLTFLAVTASHVTVRLRTDSSGDPTRGSSPSIAQHAHALDRMAVGQEAPDFTLRDLDGVPHSMRELTRGRVGVLTFWLAHCADCMESFPKGVSLTSEFAGAGVRFVDVAYLGQSKPTADWVAEMKLRNPVLLDTSGTVVSAYRVGTYTCFVLDEDGVIRYRGPVGGAFKAVSGQLAKQPRRAE